MPAHLGASFAASAPRVDRLALGPWPRPLPDWFWSWCAWVDHGRPKGKRPLTAPTKIPLWAWARYALHVKRRPPPPPPPVVPSHDAFAIYQRPIFCAEEPLAIVNVPTTYTAWLSADPAYERYLEPALRVFRAQRRPVGLWCNPTQVPVGRMRDLASRHEIPSSMLMGQAETAVEFDVSVLNGLAVVVGSLASLNADQHQKIRDHKVAFMQEDYWNVMPWLVPDWMGLPVVCSVAGLYRGEGPYGRYVPLVDFRGTGRWAVGRDGFYHAAGPQEADHASDYALL